MPQFQKKVPKHPTDCDRTLDAVLKDIKFQNKNGAKLVDYSIEADEVVLTYDD
jgi:hypothetical protein